MVGATIGIVIATACSVGVGYLQNLTLDNTDHTLRAQTRPWIAPIGMIFFENLVYGDNSAVFDVEFQLKNFGHTPAFVAVKSAVAFDGKEEVSLESTCEDIRILTSSKEWAWRFSVFPDQVFNIRSHKGKLILILPNDSLPYHPIVVGCIGYKRADFDEPVNTTGFVIHVSFDSRNNPSSPDEAVPIPRVDDGGKMLPNIDKNKLRGMGIYTVGKTNF